jgi:uncharacterized protein
VVSDLKCSKYVVFSPPFQAPDTAEVRRIAFSTFSCAWYALDPVTADALARSDVDHLTALQISHFVADRFLVPRTQDEVSSLLAENEQQDLANRDYMLTLMPSAFCQMACIYCAQHHRSLHMNPSVRAATVEFVRAQFTSGTYRNMHVTWFGGEPLTGIGAIRALTPRFQEICDKAGACYGAYVVTNGLLLNPQLVQELFHDLGVRRLAITLDGPREIHDKRRYQKNGSGTYDAIMKNLRGYAENPIPELQLEIRINVDAKNVSGLGTLVRDIIDAGIVPAITKLYVHSVFEWGNGGGRDALPDSDFATVEVEFLRLLVALKIPVQLLPTRATHACQIYYRDDSPLIDPTGNLHSCKEDPLARDSDTSPYGRTGSVFSGVDGTKGGSRTRLASALPVWRNDPNDCLNCNMQPVCGGGCEPWRDSGRKQCPGYRYNLGERLVLAYQVLKGG